MTRRAKHLKLNLPFCICLAVLFFAPLCVMAEAVSDWQLQAAKSQLQFVFEQAGSPSNGRFSQFNANVQFDPEKLAESKLEVWVELESVDTDDGKRDEVLRSPEMFDTKRWPQAHFKTSEIVADGKGKYLAQATLTIRDQTRQLEFPFSLEISQSKQRRKMALQAEITLNRFDYGLGQEDLVDDTWVAENVRVIVALRATQEAE